MSREIKFRFVCEDINKDIFYEYLTLNQLMNGFRCSRMQAIISKDEFTGLHDKDGKEIYEGDIVEYYHPYCEMEIHEVTFEPEHGYSPLFKYNKGFKIIGNIHENPELLESEVTPNAEK